MTPRSFLLSVVSATVLMSCSGLLAQTTQKGVEDRLLGKPLYLRIPIEGESLTLGPDGKVQGNQAPVSFTEAGVNVTQVELSGDHLRIKGVRMTTIFADDGKVSREPMNPRKILIEINNNGGDDFGSALSAIFADGLSDLTASLPYYWQFYARKHFLGETAPAHPMPCTNPQPNNASPCAAAGIFRVSEVVKPRVLRSVDPSFTETAHRRNFSGTVLVYLVIDEKGDPQNIQVMRPAGMGLDERAIMAVSQYKFRPATRDGKPVAVDIYIDVNFQIF